MKFTIYKIDIRTALVSVANAFIIKQQETENELWQFSHVHTVGECILVFNITAGVFIEYNMKPAERKDKVINYSCEASEKTEQLSAGNFAHEQEKINSMRDYIYFEGKRLWLSGFLNYLNDTTNTGKTVESRDKYREVVQSSIPCSDGTVGQAIYNHVIKEIL